MKKTLYRSLAAYVLSFLFTMSNAQQMKVELGEEKTAAVRAILDMLFPDARQIWDIDVYIQNASGIRTRISLTPVLKLTDASLAEFVVGVKEYDASGRDAQKLRSGNPISGEHSRVNLVAVAGDSSRGFRRVASYVLEPSHLFASVGRFGTDPQDPLKIVMTYHTIDLYQNRVVDITWIAQLDAELHFLRKHPIGIETRATKTGSPLGTFYITQTSKGISVMDMRTEKSTELPCGEICEPTFQQLLPN